MEGYKIIAVGPQSDLRKKRFTGQSVMFDGTVEYLKEAGNKVTVVNLMQSSLNPKLLDRCMDYLKIMTVFVFHCLFKRYNVAYITSSLGKTGIYRDMFFVFVLRFFGVKTIFHQYGADISGIDYLNGRVRKLFGRLMDYVSYVIIEGDYIKGLFHVVPEVEGKLLTIPNGLPYEGAHARVPKDYHENDSFKLFYLSNLIYSKGWFDVLQAIDILVNQNHLDVKCVFAGRFMDSNDDTELGISNKRKFDDFVDAHQLGNFVEYHIGLYGEEKDLYFGSQNVFLLPTYYVNEGQPVSIIEAMAYGCVPIVTCYRHIPMMVNEKNGLFVEPQSPKDIAEKVTYLINNPDKYREKSERCVEDYTSKFTFDVFANKIKDCIYSVIS